VNESISASLLVGAAGHFCPVAKMLNGARDLARVIGAQEVEYPIDAADERSFAVQPERPELFFCPDLQGYGWCFRKQRYLNVGFGRVDPRGIPQAAADFVTFLKEAHGIAVDTSRPWRGHAYRLSVASGRSVIGDAVMLLGDSAGLAYP